MKPWSVISARGRVAIPAGALESWLALYRRSPWAGAVPNDVFNAVHGELFRQLFERGAVAHLAVNPAKPDHWLGYLISERTGDGIPVVHAAFTKPSYRREGVQRSLFEAAGIDRKGRLFYTMKVGPEHRFLPAGRHEPAIARRKVA